MGSNDSSQCWPCNTADKCEIYYYSAINMELFTNSYISS